MARAPVIASGRRARSARASSSRAEPSSRLRIAMLAPPWIPVPPPAYGGIEAVVALLTRELVRRGHAVTLFAAPGSRSTAEVVPVLAGPHPEAIERALFEADHVAQAFAAIDAEQRRGRGYDVVHDHCGFTAFAMADRLATPMVHTLHGPFYADTAAFYERHAAKASVVAISHAQLAAAPANLRVVGVVPNPIDASEWPTARATEPFLLWAGRVTADKGPHRAIAAARRAGMRLVLAGPVQPGQETFFEREVAPHLDGDQVRYVGEVGGLRKRELFARAHALLMPIRWPEPFGMVMVEAMVCGTPVIAFAEGAACELVEEGITGFLVADEHEMAEACARTGEIDPVACRASVVDRFDVGIVAAGYEHAYAAAMQSAGAERAPVVVRDRRAHVGASIAAVAPTIGSA